MVTKKSLWFVLDVHTISTSVNSPVTLVKEHISKKERKHSEDIFQSLPSWFAFSASAIYSETKIFRAGGLRFQTSFLFWVRNYVILFYSVCFLPMPSTCSIWCNILSMLMFYSKGKLGLTTLTALFSSPPPAQKSKSRKASGKRFTFWLGNS